MNHSAACHEGVRTCLDASRDAATSAPVATPRLAAPGLAPSRTPAGTPLPGAATIRREPLARPSQIPVGSVRKDDADGPRYTSPVLDVAAKGTGQPLAPRVRADMEARLGADFSNVRVHTSPQATEAAAAVNAQAFTVGNNIVFGDGSYDVSSGPGRRLLAHELAHVVQQKHQEPNPDTVEIGAADSSFELQAESASTGDFSGHSALAQLSGSAVLQRAPAKRPEIKPVPALAPLEVVARQAAEIVLKNYAAQGISAGPVLTAVLDTETRKIYIGLNSGIPPKTATVIAKAIEAQTARIKGGEVIVVHSDPLAQGGGHSEPNAVDEAVNAREALLHRTLDETDLRTFELHNVWLRGADRKFTAAPRCEHCARITRSISVTSSVFFAEGGVSGEIKTPPSGGWRAPRVGPGGATGSISGEITVPEKPGAPVTPAPPATLPPTGGAVAGTTQPAGTKAEPGAPLEPVLEATPGFKPEAGATLGGAVQVLQAKMIGNLQQAEIAKYEKRLAELQPKIEAFFQMGYSVELILIVEKPNTFDFACASGAYCDQDQLVYFHDLYINSAESVRPATTATPHAAPSQPSMSSTGGRDRIIPYTHQGGSIIDEKEIPYLRTRDPSHHCAYMKQTFYPQKSISLSPVGATGDTGPQATQQPARTQNLRGIAGTYMPKYEQIFKGGLWSIPLLIGRQIQVELDGSGNPHPKMWRLGGKLQLFDYRPYALSGNIVMGGQFTAGSGLPPAAEWLSSRMEYPREGLILEWVKELDSGLNEVCDALISWHKV